jgi:thiol-disulfide isomerase/thioredoxin
MKQAAILFLLLVVGSCATRRSAHVGAGGCSAAGEVDCRPPFKVTSIEGKPIGDDLEGRIVLVNFWATWCGPCERELPALEAVYRRHKADGFVVLGVVTADRADDVSVVNFAGMRGVDYPLVRTNPELESKFGLGDALPTTLLYDRTGRLRARWNGALHEDELEDKVRDILVN